MGVKIGEMLDEHYKIDDLRAYLSECFSNNEDVQAFIKDAGEDEFKTLRASTVRASPQPHRCLRVLLRQRSKMRWIRPGLI